MKKILFAAVLWILPWALTAQEALNVHGVTITVSDLEASKTFFTELLDFEVMEEQKVKGETLNQLYGLQGNPVDLKLISLGIGKERIRLIQFYTRTGRSIPFDSRSNDLWFQHIAIVVNDMEEAYKKLWDNQVKHVSTAPQTLPDYIPAAAGISAFYFRDTDEHNLELIYFPEGKGNPRWQEGSGESPFLGIDHTAIGVSNSETSRTFYEAIGLEVAGQSHNYGTEQEHLNQVFGANLLISGLKAKEGMGVEFLSYIAPPGGRPYPEDSKVTDLWHWHTTIEVADLDKVFQTLQELNCRLISEGIVNLKGTGLGYKRGLMVRDPDGHAILLIEK
jgi:catechol 2,3-dioxygenase-like lactoylglutathione lyase family enzyme